MLLRKYAIATLISLVILMWVGCISTQPITSGQAPGFTLDNLDGVPVALSEFEGQVLVLDFWTTWCDPCIEGLPHLQEIHEQYDDVRVLAINTGEKPEDVVTFMDEQGYTFTVLLDEDNEVSDEYGVQAIPHTLVVDRAGEIHYIFGGPGALEDELQQVLE